MLMCLVGRKCVQPFHWFVLFALTLILFIGTDAFAESRKALWVANGPDVLEFGPGQLTGLRNVKPQTILASPVFAATQGVVFDRSGDLWVIDGGVTSPSLVPPAMDMFTPAQLKRLHRKESSQPTPAVRITSTVLIFPQQAVFDRTGNLWVSDNANGGPASAVYVFAKSQLTATGAVIPAVTISSNPAFNGALGIAFAPNGNLWVANNGGTNLYEFDKSHLPAPGSGSSNLIPDLILSSNGEDSIQGPWALSFDKAGDLWSSNANPPFTIVEFARSDLTATGEPTPRITLAPVVFGKHGTLSSLNAPNGISFDSSGGLGVANSAGTPVSLALFAPRQLRASGSPVPRGFIVGSRTGLLAPAGDNFGPFIK